MSYDLFHDEPFMNHDVVTLISNLNLKLESVNGQQHASHTSICDWFESIPAAANAIHSC